MYACMNVKTYNMLYRVNLNLFNIKQIGGKNSEICFVFERIVEKEYEILTNYIRYYIKVIYHLALKYTTRNLKYIIRNMRQTKILTRSDLHRRINDKTTTTTLRQCNTLNIFSKILSSSLCN